MLTSHEKNTFCSRETTLCEIIGDSCFYMLTSHEKNTFCGRETTLCEILGDSCFCIDMFAFACCREAMGHETDRCDYGTSSARSLSGFGCALRFRSSVLGPLGRRSSVLGRSISTLATCFYIDMIALCIICYLT